MTHLAWHDDGPFTFARCGVAMDGDVNYDVAKTTCPVCLSNDQKQASTRMGDLKTMQEVFAAARRVIQTQDDPLAFKAALGRLGRAVGITTPEKK